MLRLKYSSHKTYLLIGSKILPLLIISKHDDEERLVPHSSPHTKNEKPTIITLTSNYAAFKKSPCGYDG